MPNRALDWFQQSERDLEQAIASQEQNRHEWACFAAHQAAEKAVKAVHLTYNQEAWGHLIVRLLDDLPAAVTVPPILVEQGRVLDTFYIPTRHPDSHPAGSPFEHFGPLQSEDAIRYARAIAEFVRNTMAQS